MKRLLIALASMTASAGITVGTAYGFPGCAGSGNTRTLVMGYDAQFTPVQGTPKASQYAVCGVGATPNCPCKWTHRVLGEYYHIGQPLGSPSYWITMWQDAESKLEDDPCDMGIAHYDHDCQHGPFNLLYKGKWQVTHWWRVQSCNVGMREWYLIMDGNVQW